MPSFQPDEENPWMVQEAAGEELAGESALKACRQSESKRQPWGQTVLCSERQERGTGSVRRDARYDMYL